jgi:hypothetical protein
MAPTITPSPRLVKPGQLRASIKSRGRGAEEEGVEGFSSADDDEVGGIHARDPGAA